MDNNMLEKVFQLAPEWTKQTARSIRNFTRSLPYIGKERWCPVCEKSWRKFKIFGHPPREDAKCAFCGALERHRFVWLYFKKMTNLFDGSDRRILHVAPEKCFESKLQSRFGQNYITADLLDPHVMVKMDITDIQYPDESFDVIYCSHVLEHVEEDKRAMREFYRVLKQSGWAILLVPITADKTIEDPSIVEPAERLKAFGQENHVRRYGLDYLDRLQEAGFKVKVSNVADVFDKNDAVYMGLTAGGAIYYCTKV